VTQPKGFKLQFRENLALISPVVVNGFKANPATTPVELKQQYTSGGTTVDFENWIGYFVPYTQGAGTAFSSPLPQRPEQTYLDYIYSIKTQTWSTRRADGHQGGAWITDPNQYTLSEGDMVAIKLMRGAPEEMYWNTSASPEKPRLREMAQGFSYTEKLDYTPVFIEFDPADMPDEVGLFVGSECKGAAVVDSSLIAVYYYPDSSSQLKSGDELEIMFYYAGKGIRKAPEPLVYNPQTLLFEAGSLPASQLGEYGYISFNRKEGSSLLPLITELKQNYPNPFRDETKISWILAQDAASKLDIYNLRGQKIRTLFSGMGHKGRQSLTWDGKDDSGQRVASGVYFCRLSTPDTTRVQKMLVLK
ncbi:MAG TPA: FlgD immunoglobulin-like domain containing protein, partial [Candidatus Cloacimonadota bacterium]|nr:FlgD immunoglobulin-like domain containing protein [Candidatus Cloacimonadota bacterium]